MFLRRGPYETLQRLLAAAFAIALIIGQAPMRTHAQQSSKVLKRISGDVGWQASENAPYQGITAEQQLPDDAFVVTRAAGVADIVLPDSSVVRVAQAAKVKMSAFNPAQSGRENVIAIYGGSFRFKVTHPAGGQSNYRFVTPTSQTKWTKSVNTLEKSRSIAGPIFTPKTVLLYLLFTSAPSFAFAKSFTLAEVRIPT